MLPPRIGIRDLDLPNQPLLDEASETSVEQAREQAATRVGPLLDLRDDPIPVARARFQSEEDMEDVGLQRSERVRFIHECIVHQCNLHHQGRGTTVIVQVALFWAVNVNVPSFAMVIGLSTTMWVGSLSAQVPRDVAHFVASAPPGPHAAAPSETREFGRLVGLWRCSETGYEPGTDNVRAQGAAFWGWRYTADGFAVEDFWLQEEDDYPYASVLGRGLVLRQLRVFDPSVGAWRVAMVNSTGGQTPGAVFRTFTARARGPDMVMDYDVQPAGRLQRLTFGDIEADGFRLRAEVSIDEGASWHRLSQIDCVRIGGW